MRLKRVLLCSLLIVANPAKGANLTVRPSRQSAAKAVLDAARQKEPFPGVTWRPPGQVQASSGRPLCGLQDVTLVLMTPHAERIPSLLGYADWFGSVLFFLQDDAVVRPPAKGALAKPVVVLNQCALCRSAIANVSARRNVACDCHTGWAQAAESFRQHAKYMPALQRAAQMRHPHRMKGVMFSHFDMLLNVRLLEHVPSFRVPWVLESGYKGTQAAVAEMGKSGEVPYQPACFQPDEKKWGKWNWFNNSRSKCSAAWKQLGPGRRLPLAFLCSRSQAPTARGTTALARGGVRSRACRSEKTSHLSSDGDGASARHAVAPACISRAAGMPR